MSEEKPKKEKRKAVRRRRPANKIQQSDPILSEIDGIHRRWLKKQAEKKDTDPEG